MKSIISLILLVFCTLAQAATPIDGLYTGIFGGYTFLPGNISQNYNGGTINNASYLSGFEAGGNLGYKSNPMRYEAEVTYLQAGVNKFSFNNTSQTNPSGNNQAVLAMANIYVDIPNWANAILLPYLGVGIGYSWIHATLNSSTPSSVAFSKTSWPFTYQGMAGITYNFAENYALNINYRYVGTADAFGKVFQAHMANVGATYRFDGNKYK